MSTSEVPGFFQRLWLALWLFAKVVFHPSYAQRLAPAAAKAALPEGPAEQPAPPPAVKAAAPHEEHASGLRLLSLLQREGRLVDFLQEEVASFADAEVGAAARVVHQGCRKVLKEYLPLTPVLGESEGAQVVVPAGFDANRIRLTGNVTGQPPFRGVLKHHGWVTGEVHLPRVQSGLDARVIAPAEVELS